MAEEKLQYTLTLATRATGTGAKDLAADMSKLNMAVGDAKGKAKVSEWAYYDLDAQISKTAKTSESFTAGTTKVASGGKSAAQSLYIFSQGLEDAQYGMRGVLNNIPQLVIAMGGTAGLAGAISIAAVAISQLLPLLTETGVTAGQTAEDIKAIGDKMSDIKADQLDDAIQATDNARAATDALKQSWKATEEAQAKYVSASLEGDAELAEAEAIINEALGLRIDKGKQLEEQAIRAQQRRELAAKQEIEAENRRLAEVLAKVEKAKEAFDALQLQINALKLEQQPVLDDITKLRGQADQQQGVQKQADKSMGLAGYTPLGYAAEKFISDRIAKEIATSPTAKSLSTAEGLRKAIDDKIESMLQPLEEARTNLAQASTQAADDQAAIATNIARIQDVFAKGEVKAQAEDAVKTQQELAAELKATFGQVQTTNAQGKAVLADIDALTADGKITADETTRAATDMRILMGLIQSGQAASTQNIQTFIGVQNAFNATQQEIIGKLNTLQQQTGENTRRLSSLRSN